MSQSEQRHVSVQRSAKTGTHRLYCRECQLGVELPLADLSLLEYERATNHFLADHRHPDHKPVRVIDLA
jgi:hypothetical protein